MPRCLICGCFYSAVNDDAGTYKERFCSEECERKEEEEIELYIAKQEAAKVPDGPKQ